MKDIKSIAKSALAALKSAGADTAAVTAAYTETREFNVDGGEFSLFRTLFDDALSLTALKEGRRGAAQINHFDEASVRAAAENCLASAAAAEPDAAWEIAPDAGEHDFTEGAVEPDLDLLFDRCRELMDDIKREHPSILVEQMIVTHKKETEVYCNSNGSCFQNVSGAYNISLVFSAHDGDKSSSFFSSDVTTADLSKPFIQLASVKRDLEDVERQIYTKPVEGKFDGTVVVTPGCLLEVLYYSLATFAIGSAILDGTSIWKDKLGQQVADPALTVSLAPGHEDVVCGSRWTDDGYLSQDFNIIENGKLCSFIMGQYFANKTGQKRSPNASVGNMVVAAGDKPLSEIIAGIDKGLLVSRLSGGQPASSGDFSMVAKNSFLIENGQVGSAVSEVMINGNLADILNRIRAISAEKERNGSCSLPWVAFDGITISGK
ncbi:MAG: TldD/PmbA family protein [Oscillospiraceae bacterium]